MTPVALPENGYMRPSAIAGDGLVVTGVDSTGKVCGPFDFGIAPPVGQLREDLAAAFGRAIAPDGVWHTKATMTSGYSAAVGFLRSLADLGIVAPTVAALGPQAWWAWRSFKEETTRWPGQVNLVRVLLRHAPDLHPLTRRALDARTHKPRKRLYDAYSPGEFARIRAAASADVTAAELRISRNMRVLEGDATAVGDRADATVIVDGTPRDRQWLLTQLMKTGRLDLGPRAARTAAAHLLGTAPHSPTYALFPSRLEVFAMMVLLACDRGYNLSSLESLTVPDLAGSGGSDDVLVTHSDKPRRGSRRYTSQSFAGPTARVMRQIVTCTDPARAALDGLGHPTTALFIAVAASNRTLHPTGLFLTEDFPNGGAPRRWEARHDLRSDDDQPLAVTFPRLRLTEQVLNRRSSQNTEAVSEDVYRRPDARTAALVADVLLDGQQDAVEHAQTTVRMRYVDDVSGSSLPSPLQGALTAGQLDTATGACTDFTHGPQDPAGRPCTASFLYCLACPNSICTPAHLPRLVCLQEAFANFATADPTRFAHQYRDHSHRLDHLLSSIPEADLHAAKGQVTDADRDLVSRFLGRELDA